MATLKLTDATLSTLTVPEGAVRSYYWDTEQRGFGVVVGHKQRTFVARGRVNGKLVKVTIGAAGEPRPDGHLWTVRLARLEARQRLGAMAGGKVPEPTIRAAGPTLRAALDLHVSNMRKEGCSSRSIGTIEAEIPRLLPDWMNRAIVELKRSDMIALHTRLTDEGKPYLANRIVAQVSAVWNTMDRASDDGLPGRNPSGGVTRNRYTPSRARVDASDLPSWYAKVLALPSPVRRDLQLFCLFTGMRSEAARHVRWEHIDEKRGSLEVPKPKGGESKAFALPLPRTVVDMLAKRKRENRDLFGPYGGDHDWVFASLTREAPFEVQPVAEPKEYRVDPETKRKVSILPGLHTLRRTYLSVATEAGVTELDRSVLANHAFGRQSVNQTYIAQAFEHLAGEQAKIEAALWARLKPVKKRGSGRSNATPAVEPRRRLHQAHPSETDTAAASSARSRRGSTGLVSTRL